MPSCTACSSVPNSHLAAQAGGICAKKGTRIPKGASGSTPAALTLLHSPLAALPAAFWRSQHPSGSPGKEQDLGLDPLRRVKSGLHDRLQASHQRGLFVRPLSPCSSSARTPDRALRGCQKPPRGTCRGGAELSHVAAHHLCSQAPGPGSQRCPHPVPRSQFAWDARCGRLDHGAGVPLPKSLSASHETTQLQQRAEAGSTRAPFPRVGTPGRDGAGSSPPPAELRARSRPGTYFFHLVAPKLWGPQSNRKGDQCWRRREAPGVNTEQ